MKCSVCWGKRLRAGWAFGTIALELALVSCQASLEPHGQGSCGIRQKPEDLVCTGHRQG